MKNICFYHKSDMDGIFSGKQVKDFYEMVMREEIEMIGVEYNQEFYDRSILDGANVVIVDFTLSDMEDVVKRADKVTWIDHHITSKNKYPELWDKLEGLRRVGTAACELVWEYYVGTADEGLSPLDIITRIGDYDVWKFDYPDTEAVSQALNEVTKDMKFPDDFDKLDEYLSIDKYGYLVKLGEEVVKHQEYAVDNIYRKGMTVMFEGFKTRVMTSSILASKAGNYACKQPGIQVGLLMSFKGGRWVFSLRSIDEDVDVGAIASKYGGGGHKHASGFSPEDINDITKLFLGIKDE